MKKYCLVSFCNIYVCPYAKIYIDSILGNGNECDLLYWDRDCVNGANDLVDERCNKYPYQYKLHSITGYKDKIKGYLKCSQFIRTRLKDTEYDGIIFLQTHAAIACMDILARKYKNKYIVDIRDFTLENYKLYYCLEKIVLKNAKHIVISSPAYKCFLPDYNYTVAHNFNKFEREEIENVITTHKSKEKPINISFIGTVRFYEINKRILSVFKNDYRFSLNYYGTGSDVLEKYCLDNKIYNVKFYGRFDHDKMIDFYKNTDLINNVYGNNDNFLDFALSNKLYHSIQFQIPILVCPQTYMEEITLKYNIGYTIDLDRPGLKEELYDWYLRYDKELFEKGCTELLSIVYVDNKKYFALCKQFCS